MAKALLGHMTGSDPRVTAQLTAENQRLRQRVRDLEAHAGRLRAENEKLAVTLRESQLLTLDESMQPA